MTTDAAERSDNSRLIRDSAAFVASAERLQKVRSARHSLPGFERDDWKEFADLGWFGLRLPESRGGSGLGVLELCSLAEQLGEGLVAGPLVPAIVSASFAPQPWIEEITRGEKIMVPAWQEARGLREDPQRTRLHDGRLSGEKRYVAMAAGADAFLVTTRDGLAAVARDAPGLSVSLDMLQDGGHFGTLRFAATPAMAVAGDFFDSAREEITLATAAYLLGTMRKAFAITADYLATRRQFGKSIGSFQALQHRMVDLHIQIELTRASVWKAATEWDDPNGGRGDGEAKRARMLAVSRAKARASDAAMLVTRHAIQLHGAIGYTDAYDAGLYLRKAMVLAHVHGSAAEHRARFARVARS